MLAIALAATVAPSAHGFGIDGGSAGGGTSELDRNRAALESIAPNFSTDIVDEQGRLVLNRESTDLIRDSANEANQKCARLPREFRVNCLQQGYEDLARGLPKRGDYGDVQKILGEVSRELAKIERANRDRKRGKVRLPNTKRSRKYSATRSAALQQAEDAIERAKAKLLRSVPPSDPRAVHYQRIASAFDDAAVLLRS